MHYSLLYCRTKPPCTVGLHPLHCRKQGGAIHISRSVGLPFKWVADQEYHHCSHSTMYWTLYGCAVRLRGNTFFLIRFFAFCHSAYQGAGCSAVQCSVKDQDLSKDSLPQFCKTFKSKVVQIRLKQLGPINPHNYSTRWQTG